MVRNSPAAGPYRLSRRRPWAPASGGPAERLNNPARHSDMIRSLQSTTEHKRGALGAGSETPSHGHPHVLAMLHRDGQEVNAKRVYGLWRCSRGARRTGRHRLARTCAHAVPGANAFRWQGSRAVRDDQTVVWAAAGKPEGQAVTRHRGIASTRRGCRTWGYLNVRWEDFRVVRGLMREALPAALTTGFEDRVDRLSLPDPVRLYRHTRAAAIHVGATVS